MTPLHPLILIRQENNAHHSEHVPFPVPHRNISFIIPTTSTSTSNFQQQAYIRDLAFSTTNQILSTLVTRLLTYQVHRKNLCINTPFSSTCSYCIPVPTPPPTYVIEPMRPITHCCLNVSRNYYQPLHFTIHNSPHRSLTIYNHRPHENESKIRKKGRIARSR